MKILITGVCGFIGTNVALRYLTDEKNKIIGIDDLSRKGSERNLTILSMYPNFSFEHEDIRQRMFGKEEVDVIIHLAAQVGVQKSLEDPRFDFEVNALGTLNLLEYARHLPKPPFFIFASTNKVYGDIQVNKPVSENQPLNFHTPYGCSKGVADQYVLDYSRVFGVPGVVFRQSCIYGPYQHGAEEQGWVAWFLIANQTRQQLTIFGDGNQVRDCLYIDDLVALYDKAIKHQDKFNGQAFNIGGGPENTLSLNQLVEKAKITTSIKFADWRKADQKYYVSDITKIGKLGWKPKVSVDRGLKKLKKYVEATWLR